MTDSYRGVFGAIPYAIRNTDSWAMRVYGVVGAVAAAFITLVVTLGLVVWMGETAEVQSGTFLFSRSLYVIAGFAAVAPLLAPLLFVARRHRRDDRVAAGYDRWLAAAGFVFLVSLYLGMVISAPADLRDPTDSVVVSALYALPPRAGFAPPIAGAGLVFLTHFRLRDAGDAGEDGEAPGASDDERAGDHPGNNGEANESD
ncbi:hypothetical protein [Halorubrum tibetense]|uniref:DUF8056 domain-containing protein n=1 Tax=Halorubrum tibetense TaxID=175631 RepID=A0ABD5SB75_9EURY